MDFVLTSEQAEGFPYKEQYLQTELAVALSQLRDEERVKKLTGADIFRYIKAEELADEIFVDGRRKKTVFEKGIEAGLYLAPRMSQKGTEYEDIYFGEAAQRMIVQHYTK